MGICLTVHDRAGRSQAYAFDVGQIATLGRHANNAVLVDDQHASRWHAVVVCDGRSWLIQEIGAPVNGTRLQGRRIEGQAELTHGDEIAIGDTRLQVAIESEHFAGPVPAATDWASTPLGPDELADLCGFLSRAVDIADHQALVRLALETAVHRTQASVAGYLSVEPDPQPKVIWPEQEQVDVSLSRQLTQQVLHTGRAVWAAANVPATLSDSLRGFTDALCIPVRATAPIAPGGPCHAGAIHLYRKVGTFDGAHQRFMEAIAGCFAGYLAALRTRRRLEADNARLTERVGAADVLIGDSPAMKTLRTQIARAAAQRSTVLVRGETGVGKELVALALHRQSQRFNGPLVVVNCATLSGSLVEAQLFGHRKGAFTGADRDRPGLFEEGDEGTVFLDEIGDLPLDCQAKVLRVIEGHGFRPVGASAEIRVDTRIVAATNRDLEEEVKTGRFRRDLLYRLQVIEIQVPPLRERLQDVPALVEFYLARLAKGSRMPFRLTEAALTALNDYAWPGNVRQLIAVLERAVAMSDGDTLTVHDLHLPTNGGAIAGRPLNLEQLEAWAVREALQRTKGNVTQAAKLLGISRDTVAMKMKQNNIERNAR